MKSNAAGAPPIDGAKQCTLAPRQLWKFKGFTVCLPLGAPPVKLLVAADNGDEPWLEPEMMPSGDILQMVGTRKRRA